VFGVIAQHVRRLVRCLRGAGHEVELLSIETLDVRLRMGLANPGYSLLTALKSPMDRSNIAKGRMMQNIISLGSS